MGGDRYPFGPNGSEPRAGCCGVAIVARCLTLSGAYNHSMIMRFNNTLISYHCE